MSFNKAEFGQYPQEWSIATLGEYIEVLTDYHANGAYKKLKENVELLDEENYSIMIRTTNFEQNDFSLKSFKYINEHAYNFLSKTKVYDNDILMNKIANAGSVYLMPKLNKPVSLAMNLFLIRFNEKVIVQKYAYYFMKNYEAYIKTRAQGSVTKTITKENVRKLEIAFPNVQEQKAIVKILSDIEEKIEANNQINKKLEGIAKAIFKQWFVDFEFPNEEGEPYKSSGGEMVESDIGMIPKGWAVTQLGEVSEFQNGYAFKSKELEGQDTGNCYHVFKMGHIKKGGGLDKSGTKSYVNKDDCLNLQRYVIRKGDLLMCMTDMKSNVALLGHTALMDENDKYILNQRVGLIRANQPSVLNYSYIYILTNSFDFIENLRSRANSGVQVNLSTKEIKESLVVVPNRNIHKKFDDVAINLFEKIFILEQENERLIKLRDTLLPKLMSGEIRVPLECNEN